MRNAIAARMWVTSCAFRVWRGRGYAMGQEIGIVSSLKMAIDDRLTKSVTLIKDLRPGMKNVTCVFIVIEKGQYWAKNLWLLFKQTLLCHNNYYYEKNPAPPLFSVVKVVTHIALA